MVVDASSTSTIETGSLESTEIDLSAVHAVVLAAGMGKRMKSDLPKVLVRCLGRPLVEYVLAALEQVGIRTILVVVGYRAQEVRAAIGERPGLVYVEQSPQLGTGHAVAVCREWLEKLAGPTLVLTGDSPMVQPSSLRKLLSYFLQHRCRTGQSTGRLGCLMGTLYHPNPTGLGRIVRDPTTGEFLKIVEERDATDVERAIREVNMSTYVFDTQALLWALERLSADNRQKEYYLTDCPGLMRNAGWLVEALPVLEPCEALSVNTPEELAAVEAEMRRLRGL
ncbi:MAG: UDP-N-acetylglucosamine pyrophosphorylase [Pirellulaceae bacterium]|nr:MAG: UDP-N-acetylglucosamine pyrophosphorylase [Pirellulaceae bacterium]